MTTFKFDQALDSPEVSTNPPSRRLHFKAVGWDNADQVLSVASATFPTQDMVDGQIVYRQPISVRYAGFQIHDIEVTYSENKDNQHGSYTWDFDTSGGTVHITNSIATSKKYPTALAPSNDGAIGVDGDNVNGCEIVIPVLNINVHFSHPKGVVTLPHAKKVANLTGKVNSTKFLTFDPGEVLFLGGSGSDGSDAPAQVTYRFAMSPNSITLAVGNMTNIEKKGHEYLWVRYEPKVEAGQPTQVPLNVYIEQVYLTEDFSGILGFGG